MSRTEKSRVVFKFPFTLGCGNELHPPGTYLIETDYELLAGMTFPVYRRKKMLLHILAPRNKPAMERILVVEPNLMDDAMDRDDRAKTVRSREK